MTFALFVYDSSDALEGLSGEEQQAIYDDYRAFAETPGIVGYRLQPAGAATTVRLRDGEPDNRPGPLGAATETIAGFYLLESDDPDEARAVAARIPAARLGGAIEVRPIMGDR
jgi:hypothetical protein